MADNRDEHRDGHDHAGVEQIRAEMWENYRAPNGSPRNAKAEQLVARAEATGDTGLLLETLSQLITAYEYSAERGKMFVPFARMLQMWDQDPGRFDDQMAYELFWRFKWVTGSMLDYPDIPLASIEQWLAEMERRYRLAGYNARTVRAEDFFVGWHLGDIPRAERAYADWLAGDRDRMSNCHACEAGSQGRWEAYRGRDELALERWSEVLAGRLTCAEEPHRVLSYSLLPLVRLGRTDQARTHHLRGYRMARGNESLLSTVGRHIEFCALTGNEARGLEILAEHARHLDGDGTPESTLSLLEAAVLLLSRLMELGLGDRDTTGPAGRSWKVSALHAHCEELRTALAARFDLRNGTDTVSSEGLARINRRPLLDRLPLGLGTVLSGAPQQAAAAPAALLQAALLPAGATFEELLTEARRLRDLGHPNSRRAWLAVEEALGEREPEPLLRAELAGQRGARCGRADAAAALAAFDTAAEAYRAADRPGDAAADAARAAVAAALLHRAEEAERRIDGALAAVRAALAEQRATTRQLALVLLCRARVLTALATEGGGTANGGVGGNDGGAGSGAAVGGGAGTGGAGTGGGAQQASPERAEAALVEAMAATGQRDGLSPADLRRMDAMLGDAHHHRAALLQHRPELAAPELRAAADAHLRAGAPWDAVGPLIPLARLLAQSGDLAAAEAVAEETLRHDDGYLDAEDAGHVRLLLADLLGHRNAHQDAIGHALEATRWLEQAGLGAEAGAAARSRLAQSYQALGRHAEAAEVLQAALPDLAALGEQSEVNARRTLGESLGELNEHAAAAEQFALAARIVDGWGEPYPSAQLASSTAEALSAAGRGEEAEAAYLRAQELWAQAGVPAMVVRTLRARAWLTFRSGRDAAPGRALMLAAEGTARAALADPGPRPEEADGMRRELADTWRQLGALLRDVAEDDGWNRAELSAESQAALYREAWDCYRAASERFAECAPPGPALAVQALLDAARIRIETGQSGAAAVELKQVLVRAEEAGGSLQPLADRARSLLRQLEQQATD
jgi:hypothetical protein